MNERTKVLMVRCRETLAESQRCKDSDAALLLGRSAYAEACQIAALLRQRKYSGDSVFGDPDPCQDEVDAVEAQTLIRNASLNCYEQEQAALESLEQALMDCRANN